MWPFHADKLLLMPLQTKKFTLTNCTCKNGCKQMFSCTTVQSMTQKQRKWNLTHQGCSKQLLDGKSCLICSFETNGKDRTFLQLRSVGNSCGLLLVVFKSPWWSDLHKSFIWQFGWDIKPTGGWKSSTTSIPTWSASRRPLQADSPPFPSLKFFHVLCL